MLEFYTKGVCSKKIYIEVENEIVKKIIFEGGCNGNLKGISSLTEGMHIDNIIEKLSGITCGKRSSSCPDQLSRALIKHFK